MTGCPRQAPVPALAKPHPRVYELFQLPCQLSGSFLLAGVTRDLGHSVRSAADCGTVAEFLVGPLRVRLCLSLA